MFVWLWLISTVTSLPVANDELTCKYTVYPCCWVVHVYKMTRVMNTVNVGWGNDCIWWVYIFVFWIHIIEFICSRDFNYVVDCRCIIDKGMILSRYFYLCSLLFFFFFLHQEFSFSTRLNQKYISLRWFYYPKCASMKGTEKCVNNSINHSYF